MSLLDEIAAKVKAACGENTTAGGVVDRLLAYVHDTQASGGLTGIVQQLQNGGLGHLVQSWISTGQNLPVSAEQIKAALGSGKLAEIAARLGISPEMASQRISEILPHVVDHLTPTGVLPPAGVADQIGATLKTPR